MNYSNNVGGTVITFTGDFTVLGEEEVGFPNGFSGGSTGDSTRGWNAI